MTRQRSMRTHIDTERKTHTLANEEIPQKYEIRNCNI